MNTVVYSYIFDSNNTLKYSEILWANLAKLWSSVLFVPIMRAFYGKKCRKKARLSGLGIRPSGFIWPLTLLVPLLLLLALL